MTLALAASLEAYARLKEEPAPATAPGGLWERDPTLGLALRPGFRGESHSGFGVRVQVEVNSRGQRDAEVLVPKPPGTFRIACLGGSTTFGFGAPTGADAWPNVLERLLSQRSGRPVDVLNCGVHSWTLGTSLAALPRLEDLQVDALVVLHGHNDLYASFDPAYAAASRGEVVTPSASTALLGALEQSAAVRRYRRRWLRWRRRHLKADHLDPDGLAAWERNLTAAVEGARARDRRLLLCTFPRLLPPTAAEAEALYPPESGRWEDFLRHSVHDYPVFVAGLERYDEAVRDAAKAEGLALCDLARDLPRDPAHYVDYIHRNAAGHAALAEQVATAIEAAGWLR